MSIYSFKSEAKYAIIKFMSVTFRQKLVASKMVENGGNITIKKKEEVETSESKEKHLNSPFRFTGLGGKKYKVTLKEKLFCEHYLDFKGNGVDAVFEAGYEAKNAQVAAVIAYENLTKPHINAYITLKLEEYGYSDDIVEKQHLWLINQFANPQAKAKGIDMFYKVKNKYPAERVIDEGLREKVDDLSERLKVWIEGDKNK